jgi:thioredoxin reductase (NADPH)
MQHSIHETDIAIIGAGPVGLFAIFEAGMLKMKCHVIDTLDFVGGQCTALYPEKPIYDIPAHPSITGEQLIENLSAQAAPFSPVFHLGQQVVKLDKQPDGWLLTTSKNERILAKVVLISAGCGAFGPNRPPIEGLDQYEGKSIFYMVGKKEEFRNKRVVIAGGGDSAVDWAISLADVASHVYVVHRRQKFRCAPESEDRLRRLASEGKRNVELIIPYQLDSLVGKNGTLEHVVVSTLEGEKKPLNADILLPFFGLAMELGPIANWGLGLTKNHIQVHPTTLATNEPGIFAIGDIATYENKLKLILNGFAEASLACYAARNIIHPNQDFHFEYSTTQGVPNAA